jgi:hypothetical protein
MRLLGVNGTSRDALIPGAFVLAILVVGTLVVRSSTVEWGDLGTWAQAFVVAIAAIIALGQLSASYQTERLRYTMYQLDKYAGCGIELFLSIYLEHPGTTVVERGTALVQYRISLNATRHDPRTWAMIQEFDRAIRSLYNYFDESFDLYNRELINREI